MVGQQRQQISELQFDKFPHSHLFSCWKIRFKTQVTTCSDFPSEAMVWVKEVEVVDRGILHSTTPSATGEVPLLMSTGALVARDEERIGSTVLMPTFGSRPSTMNSFLCRWIFHRVPWLDSKDSIFRNINLMNSHSIIIFVLEEKVQKPGDYLF